MRYLVLLIVTSLLLSCTSLQERGNRAFQDQEYDMALNYYEKSLKERESREVRYNRSLALLYAGDFKLCIEECKDNFLHYPHYISLLDPAFKAAQALADREISTELYDFYLSYNPGDVSKRLEALKLDNAAEHAMFLIRHHIHLKEGLSTMAELYPESEYPALAEYITQIEQSPAEQENHSAH